MRRKQSYTPVLVLVAAASATSVALGTAVAVWLVAGRAQPAKPEVAPRVGPVGLGAAVPPAGTQPAKGPIVWQEAESGLRGATMSEVRRKLGAPSAIHNNGFGFGTQLHDTAWEYHEDGSLLVVNFYEGRVVEAFRRAR